MATAVLDLDISELPDEVAGLGRYQRALVLLRLRGRPAGQALLPVVGGRVGGDDLAGALLGAADSAFWERWLADYLGLEPAAPPPPAPPATVAVCTRDRTDDLRRCLDALLRLPDDGQELLVVDNCPSSDATRELVAGYPRVRYVREGRPGLNVARNRALREAARPLVAFTDDDAAPDPGWLRALLRNFDSPRVACATGLTMPIELETPAQEWFQRLGGLGRGFKRTVFDAVRWDPLEGWVAGAGVNMALSRAALDVIGHFDERFDVGTPTRGGGDTELFGRALAAGFQIVYDPEALVWHRHRREWPALRRQLFGYELAGFAVWSRALVHEGEFGTIGHVWRWLLRELPNLARAALGRRGSPPLDLVAARICGAPLGPWGLLQAHRQARRTERGA